MREHPILSWSTQFLFGKIQDKGQSASNFVGQSEGDLPNFKHKGSSETTREINNNNVYLKKLDEKFKF
jgi:hypothetical protein